jgi:hypothetical protein
MYPKLIVAVALFGAMSTSAFAEWNPWGFSLLQRRPNAGAATT